MIGGVPKNFAVEGGLRSFRYFRAGGEGFSVSSFFDNLPHGYLFQFGTVITILSSY